MALDDTTKGLWDQLNSLTEPNADFEAVRAQVNAASRAVRSNYAPDPVKGIARVDKVADFSEIYLKAAGFKFPDKSLSKSYMENILQSGGVYDNFTAAIEKGDIDEAVVSAKNAFTLNKFTADIRSVAERIPLLPMEEKIAFAKHAVKEIGGDDYTRVLDNIPGYIQVLRQFKAMQGQFKDIRQSYTA